MAEDLKQKLASGPKLTEGPLRFLQWMHGLTDDQWYSLLKALREDNRLSVAEILGLSEQQIEDLFKKTRDQARDLSAHYPDLTDRKKGF
jgi:hypothetical protein